MHTRLKCAITWILLSLEIVSCAREKVYGQTYEENRHGYFSTTVLGLEVCSRAVTLVTGAAINPGESGPGAANPLSRRGVQAGRRLGN